MNDTHLDLSFRRYRIDGLGETGQIVNRGDQNILYAPIIEVGGYRSIPSALVGPNNH